MRYNIHTSFFSQPPTHFTWPIKSGGSLVVQENYGYFEVVLLECSELPWRCSLICRPPLCGIRPYWLWPPARLSGFVFVCGHDCTVWCVIKNGYIVFVILDHGHMWFLKGLKHYWLNFFSYVKKISTNFTPLVCRPAEYWMALFTALITTYCVSFFFHEQSFSPMMKKETRWSNQHSSSVVHKPRFHTFNLMSVCFVSQPFLSSTPTQCPWPWMREV